jgi:16S rRNA (adenine1518-N6/adenine1519-N6)-dimethyltransferase
VHAKKRLGQNFLRDESVIARIVDDVNPRADETMIEIGPGTGALTARLIEKAGRLLTVEYDRDLARLLINRFQSHANFALIQADALTVNFCELIAPAKRARVVANLPYYISTAILQHLIEQRRCLTEMVLMLQREVVSRITAAPNNSERGFLSVFIEAYTETEKLFDVAPAAFEPMPKVWSTVVRLRVRQQMAADVEDEKLLWRVVGTGFAQRRKTLFNNFRYAGADLSALIEKAGGVARLFERARVDSKRRAESLSLEDWAQIARAFVNPKGEASE